MDLSRDFRAQYKILLEQMSVLNKVKYRISPTLERRVETSLLDKP